MKLPSSKDNGADDSYDLAEMEEPEAIGASDHNRRLSLGHLVKVIRGAVKGRRGCSLSFWKRLVVRHVC